MHPIEAAMKARLDGTFTRFRHVRDGTIVTTADVDRDFVPDYNTPPAEARKVEGNGGAKRKWSRAEDDHAIRLYAHGHTYAAIAAALGRPAKSVSVRLTALRDMGVI